MRPTCMTKFGVDENGVDQGNCLTACVASLLEVDIDTLPDFSAKGKDWHRFTVEYLRSRGLSSVFIPIEMIRNLIVFDCQCICIYNTHSAEHHAVIGSWNSEWDEENQSWSFVVATEFDPHPEGVMVTSPHAVFLVMGPISSAAAPGGRP